MNIFKVTSFRVSATLFLTISIYCIITQIGGAESNSSIATFDRNLANIIFTRSVAEKEENVIFSPASIQTVLALLFFGAGEETAQELRNALQLGNQDTEAIVKKFEHFVGSFKGSNDDFGAQLRMVNRIYVAEHARLKSNFNEIATRAFQSQAEQVNFTDSANTVRKINQFVEEQTQNKIKDLLSKDSVDSLTRVVVINAIYFKAKWEVPFNALDTSKSDFFYAKHKVQVDTMHMKKWVSYGEFPDLDAKALELRYRNSNLSMLFLLPNTVDGLIDMEEKLARKTFHEISSNLKSEEVYISIPKFRIKYEIDLIQPLEELGLKTMFQADKADLSGLLENPNGEYVTEVKHEAFIQVDEAGTEAAGSTGAVKGERILENHAEFKADHPFVFALRDEETVYFIGYVLKLDK